MRWQQSVLQFILQHALFYVGSFIAAGSSIDGQDDHQTAERVSGIDDVQYIGDTVILQKKFPIFLNSLW